MARRYTWHIAGKLRKPGGRHDPGKKKQERENSPLDREVRGEENRECGPWKSESLLVMWGGRRARVESHQTEPSRRLNQYTTQGMQK